MADPTLNSRCERICQPNFTIYFDLTKHCIGLYYNQCMGYKLGTTCLLEIMLTLYLRLCRPLISNTYAVIFVVKAAAKEGVICLHPATTTYQCTVTILYKR